MSGWVKSSFLKPEVGPGARGTLEAGESILANGFVKLHTDGTALAADPGDVDVIGVALPDSDEASWIDGDLFTVQYSGVAQVLTASPIEAGEFVKVGDDTAAVTALTSATAGVTIDTGVGIGFTNQPTNDGVEVISASTADTQQLTIWGTTNGGVVVVKETVTLTGTTQVATVKTDWGVILGVEIPNGQKPAAGTITVREASGNGAITTITAGNRRSGVVNVPPGDQRAFNHRVAAAAEGATTKVVGVVGEDAAADEQSTAIALSGTTKVYPSGTYSKIQKLLVGDLESTRTLTLTTDIICDTADMIVGKALETVDAGELVSVLLGDKSGLTNAGSKKTTGTIAAPVDMAGNELTIVLGTAGAAQVKLLGDHVYLDANFSGGGSSAENVVMPAAGLLAGKHVWLHNVGGEDITVNTSLGTISAAESAMVVSDGTTWRVTLVGTST